MKNKWIQRQQQIVDAARAAGRGLTAEEQREFDELQRKIDQDGQDGAGAQGGEPQGGQRDMGGQNNDPQGGDPQGGQRDVGGQGAAGNPAPAGNDQDAQQRAVAEERQRNSDIVALCRQTGMDPAEFIRTGATMDTVRQAAVTHLLQHGAPIQTGARDRDQDNFRAGAVDAILMRAGVNVERPAESVDQFRGMSLRDLAIECMARDGQGTTTSLLRMGRDDLWNMACRQFFNPTAAFPAILDNAIRKAIEHRYNHVPTTFQLWTSRGSVTDFKPTRDHSYLIGGAGEFKLVGENGELKADTPKSELLPQRKIDTYGRQFSMTRQAFINDDIGFITEVPGLYAASAKRTINKQVYTILVKNPAIFDGVALFDDAHNNDAKTGAAPSIDTLQKMMLKLLRQKDPFGEAIMVQPKYIIVPVGYGFLLSQLLETQVLDVEGIGNHTVNALYNYRNQLTVIEEGALNALAGAGQPVPWFMVGDPSHAKSLQVDYLNGQEAPTIRRSEVPGQLGYVWDIWLDWGITAVDYRGIARNKGVAITEDE